MGTWPLSLGQPVDYAQGPTGGFATGVTAYHASLYAGAKGRPSTYRRRLIVRHRSLTISGQIRDSERATEDELADLDLEPLPRTRADCASGYRPCPYVSCKHHLYIEVNPVTGSVQFPFGALGIDEIPQSCSLDVADRGDHTLEEVGGFTSRTKERIRQIETRASLIVKAAGLSPSMMSSKMADWMDID